jgi:thioesterase domain-containing protein
MREQSAAELWSWARMFASARIAAARDALNRKVFGLKERFQPQRPIDSQAKLFDYVLQQNRIAVYDYAQRPLPRYPGRLTVVLAEATSMSAVSDDVDPRLGWRETADLGIEVHRVPGNHLSMLEPPFADALAAVLRDCLERAHRDAAARSAPAQVAKGA